MKRWFAVLLLVATLWLPVTPANATGLCSLFKTWNVGDVLTAADLNASFTQVGITNLIVTCMSGYSATLSQMQTTVNPYPGGGASLATDLAGELARLRYQIQQLSGQTQWYVTPQDGPRPNLLADAGMEAWSAGTSAAPDSWTQVGAGGTVAREGTQVKHGTYAAAVTRAGTDTYLTQDVTTVAGGTKYIPSRTYTLAVWTRSTVASRVRIGLYDGVSVTYSSYEAASGTYTLVTVQKTLASNATVLQIRLQVDTGDTTGWFDGAMLVDGTLAPTFMPSATQDGAGGIAVHATNSLSESINTATYTALTFDTNRFDTADLHSIVSNTSRLTAPVAGIYQITCTAQFATNGTGDRRLKLRLNAATDLAQSAVQAATTASATTDLVVTTLYRLAATDYVECHAYQASGGALNVSQISNLSPEFMMVRLGF